MKPEMKPQMKLWIKPKMKPFNESLKNPQETHMNVWSTKM